MEAAKQPSRHLYLERTYSTTDHILPASPPSAETEHPNITNLHRKRAPTFILSLVSLSFLFPRGVQAEGSHRSLPTSTGPCPHKQLIVIPHSACQPSDYSCSVLALTPTHAGSLSLGSANQDKRSFVSAPGSPEATSIFLALKAQALPILRPGTVLQGAVTGTLKALPLPCSCPTLCGFLPAHTPVTLSWPRPTTATPRQ